MSRNELFKKVEERIGSVWGFNTETISAVCKAVYDLATFEKGSKEDKDIEYRYIALVNLAQAYQYDVVGWYGENTSKSIRSEMVKVMGVEPCEVGEF